MLLVMFRLPPILIAFLGLGIPAQTTAEPLKTAVAIRALPREVADQKLPAVIQGVVTYVRTISTDGRAISHLVIDDATAGIYVAFEKADLQVENFGVASNIQVGMRLEITGATAAGGYAPMIRASAGRYLGIGELPSALPATYSDFRSGRYDCKRVEVRGVIQRISTVSDPKEYLQRSSTDSGPRESMQLELAVPGGPLSVFIIEPKGMQPEQFVDAEVICRGVALTAYTPRGEAIDAYLRVANPQMIQVLRPPAPDPFAVKEVHTLALRPFRSEGPNLHRQRLTGIITLTWPGSFFYVKMKERSFRVHTRSTEPLVVGDEVEVSGFVDQSGDHGFMREAIYRRVSHSDPPQPSEISRAEILSLSEEVSPPRLRHEDYDGRLVRMKARLMDLETKPDQERRLFLECDGGIFIAMLDRTTPITDLQHLVPSSMVEVTGICVIKFSSPWSNQELPVPEDFTLILPGPEAVQVLSRPSRWTPEILIKLLAVVVSLLIITIGLVFLMRRQVSRRTADLAREMRIRQEQDLARHDTEVEFSATLRERERLAADLHDTLSQTLTGVAMQLDATRRAPEPAQAQRNLTLASQMLSRGREEVRRSVWNLRANELDSRLLREAIRHLAEVILEGSNITLTVGGTGDERRLPDLIAGNMLMLAKEALTNAIKHAQPSQIDIAVDYQHSSVTLTFHDDGYGFDPVSVPGPHEGHFGLTGMRERSNRIGGQFTLESSSSGTTISLRVAETGV